VRIKQDYSENIIEMADQYSWSTESDEEVLLAEEVNLGWSVILFNDEVNTFDWVILCLIKYCGHDLIQAQQCALIVHNNGKCKVKNGSLEELEPICMALLDSGLSAKLEQ
jgi:ATP-dependent Clp protease adaptor protein ClpS